MFSLNYFNYLIKSKKYLLLLIAVIALANVVACQDSEVALNIQFFISMFLSFVMPITIFYHVHDKKAADTYFSLPVSRKKILFTGLLFCFLVAYIPFLIPIINHGIRHSSLQQMFTLIIVMAIVLLALIVFNTMIYLIANNVIDGVIFLGAYSCLPLFIYVVINNFIHAYVAGGTGGFDLSFVNYFSLLALALELLSGIQDSNTIDYLAIIILLVTLVVSILILKKQYVDRKIEKAGTRSDNFFGYPLIINVYVFICLAIIATAFDFNIDNLITFISNYFIFYLLLFAIYVVAYFVYKRRFTFSYKLLLNYILAIIITLMIALGFKNTKAFGLSDKYIVKNNNHYGMSMWNFNSNDDIYALLRKTGDQSDADFIQVYVEVGDEKYNMPITDSTLKIMESLRREAIVEFYDTRSEDDYITSLYVNSKDDNNHDRYYQYSLKVRPTLAQLQEILKDPLVKVFVYTESNQYMLNADGELINYNN